MCHKCIIWNKKQRRPDHKPGCRKAKMRYNKYIIWTKKQRNTARAVRAVINILHGIQTLLGSKNSGD